LEADIGTVLEVKRSTMSEIRYVVVCSDGTSYDLSRRAVFLQWGKTKKPEYDLQELLQQGWLPVRETGMGGGEHFAYALVLLKKETV
jgi:hypothetical protein